MGGYALIKDGFVINTIVWDGPDVSPIDFGEGVSYVEIKEGEPVSIGYSYDGSKFTPPPPTKEEVEANQNEIKSANLSKKRSLLDEASQKISILQDAVDLDMATDDEAAALPLWKKYRVLLSRVDAETSEEVKFPEKPTIP